MKCTYGWIEIKGVWHNVQESDKTECGIEVGDEPSLIPVPPNNSNVCSRCLETIRKHINSASYACPPVCPFCGYEDDSWWEQTEIHQDGTHDWQCGHCDTDMKIKTFNSIEFTIDHPIEKLTLNEVRGE